MYHMSRLVKVEGFWLVKTKFWRSKIKIKAIKDNQCVFANLYFQFKLTRSIFEDASHKLPSKFQFMFFISDMDVKSLPIADHYVIWF